MTHTREEHLQWCKDRAFKYLDEGDVKSAIASMLSDVRQHPLTQPHPAIELLGLRYAVDNDLAAARRYIEGFR